MSDQHFSTSDILLDHLIADMGRCVSRGIIPECHDGLLVVVAFEANALVDVRPMPSNMELPTRLMLAGYAVTETDVLLFA
jgi:hypothetical protein